MLKDFSNQREKIRYYHSLSGERKIGAFCEMLEKSEMTVFREVYGKICGGSMLYP